MQSYWHIAPHDISINQAVRQGILAMGYYTSIIIPIYGKLSEITLAIYYSKVKVTS